MVTKKFRNLLLGFRAIGCGGGGGGGGIFDAGGGEPTDVGRAV